MMLSERHKQFLQFCFSQGKITQEQIKKLQQAIETVQRNQETVTFFQLLQNVLQLSNDEIYTLQQSYRAEMTATQVFTTEGMHETCLIAQEIFTRGIADLGVINQCLRQKCEGDIRNFLQIMLAHKLIGTKDFLLIQKHLKDNPNIELQHIELQRSGNTMQFVAKKSHKKIGAYEIVRELGRGGMGIVYEAQDPKLQRTVAIKTLISQYSSESERERFIREARLVASLQHPAIIHIHEINVENDTIFFVMDYIDGLSLHDYIEAVHPTLDEKISILETVTEALGFAHSKGIIHRDIKPDNIMVDWKGQPFLMDFGLAREISGGDNLTVSGAPLGTPAYMSPEQVQGDKKLIKKTTDIYSFGVVLYEVLVGRPPFAADNINEIYNAILHDTPVSPRELVQDLPKDLETICLKCLEKDPRKRYVNTRALAADIKSYLKGDNIRARPISRIEKTMRWMRRNTLLCAFLFLLMISLPSFLYMFLLAPGKVRLTIQGKVGNAIQDIPAEIFVDEQKATEKTFSLRRGYHKFRLESPGYDSLTFFVDLNSGEEISIQKQLTRAQGRISITSQVSGIKAVFKNLKTQEEIQLFAPVYQQQIAIGDYQVVFSKENHFPQTKQLSITQEKPLQVNIHLETMEVWQKKFERESRANVGDLNHDGSMELYVALRDKLEVYDLWQGKKLWQYTRNLSDRVDGLQFHDINGDGIKDIFIYGNDDFTILNGQNHQELFVVPSWWGSSYELDDVNNDGFDDVILFSKFKGIRAFNSRDNQILWQIPGPYTNATLRVAPHQILFIGNDQLIMLNTQTQKQQLVKESQKYQRLLTFQHQGQQRILLYGYAGAICFDLRTSRVFWEISKENLLNFDALLFDINHDGNLELLLQLDHLYCMDLNGKILWESPVVASKFPMKVADFDKNGTWEIVLKGISEIYILSETGEKLSEFSFPQELRSVILVDTTGDGFLEILCLAGKFLYAMRPLPQQYFRYYSPKLPIESAVTIDVNGDHFHDFVVCDKTGTMHCLNGANMDILWSFQWRPHQYNIYSRTKQNKQVVAIAGKDMAIFSQTGQKVSETTFPEPLQYPVLHDINGDGLEEIFYKSDRYELICLEGVTQKMLWRRALGTKQCDLSFYDINNDNIEDVIGLAEVRNRNRTATVFCVDGKSGNVFWTQEVVHPGDNVLGTTLLSISGQPYIIANQVSGVISCLEGKTGRILWQNQTPFAAISSNIVVADLKNNGEYKIVAGTDSGKILCFDFFSGKLIWSHQIPGGQYKRDFVISTTQLSQNQTGIMITFPPYVFYIVDADGKWIWETTGDVFFNNPQIQDLNQDGKDDVWGITEEKKLLQIFSWREYLEKARLPKFISNLEQDTTYAQAIHFYKAIEKDSYQQISQYNFLQTEAINDFSRAIVHIKQQEYQNALSLLQKFQTTSPESFEAAFVLFVIACNKNMPEAAEQLEKLLSNSIWIFEHCRQRYQDLFTDSGNNFFSQILPKISRKTSVYKFLSRAYDNSVFMEDISQQQNLLRLCLRYADPQHENYPLHRQKFFQEIQLKISRNQSLYSRYIVHDILWEGLQLLPDDSQLTTQLATMYIENKDYLQALKILEYPKTDRDEITILLKIVCLALAEQHQTAKQLLSQTSSKIQEHKTLLSLLQYHFAGDHHRAKLHLQNLARQKRYPELLSCFAQLVLSNH